MTAHSTHSTLRERVHASLDNGLPLLVAIVLHGGRVDRAGVGLDEIPETGA